MQPIFCIYRTLQPGWTGPGRITIRSQATTQNNAVSAKPFESLPGRTGIYSWKYIGVMLQMKPFSK